MVLYSLRRNSAGWRVRIALHYKQISFRYVPRSTMSADEYHRINPQGLLPALEVDGRVIPQSNAILELLEERHPAPPLLPVDSVDRACVRAFAQYIACDLHPLSVGRVRRELQERFCGDEAAIAGWLQHWNVQGLQVLETMLASGPETPFCFGHTPTFADLHLVPQLYNARRFGCDLTPFPRLLAVDATARQTPCFVEAAPEHLPDWTGDEPSWLGG